MTDRPPRPLRFALPAALVGAVAALSGCGTLSPRPTADGKPPESPVERGQAQAAPAAAAVRPSAYSTRVGQYVFHTDFPLDTADSLFRELEDLPEQIERELKLPTGTNLIRVYLFDDEARYHAFLKAKDRRLPLRSAYFFAEPARGTGVPPDLHVYTWAGPRVRTDLRHELTHALLHGTLKGVPLWLDEGLAGFFEQPPANDGVNLLHLDALRNGEVLRDGPFRGDLARLERLSTVNDMGRPEYQEAWAWVHFMLRGNGKARQVLLDHLQALRATPTPGSLLTKLTAALGDPNPLLLAYLSTLDLPAPGKVRQPSR
jgi:hypothetical protein